MLIMYLTLIDNPTDREIFTQLYSEHRQSMFYFANLFLKNDTLAEDAVHDAFLRLANNFNRFDFSKDSRNLLLTLTKHAALTILNKRSHEIYTFDSVGIDFESTAYSLEDHYENYAKLVKILDIVDSMSYEYSTVFRLRYLHDMKFSDIAATLGITVAAAKKRIQRIKERIEQVLAWGDGHDEI